MEIGKHIRTARRRAPVVISAISLLVAPTAVRAATGSQSAKSRLHGPQRHHAHRRRHRAAHGVGYASGVSCAGGVCFTGDPFYLYAGQCTWYAAGRRPDLNGIVHGNAGDWLNEAAGRVPEGSVPVVGAIAVWRPNTGGAFGAGHVAYVAGVSGAGVTVQDFNWGRPAESYHEHAVPASWISGYIYGGPAGSGPAAVPPPPPPPPPPPAPTPTPVPTPPQVPPSEGAPSPAPVVPSYYVHRVTGTCRDGACGLRLRTGSGYSTFAAVGSLPEGAEADVVCQSIGETVSNGFASSAVWDRLTDGYWVSDFYIDTPNVGTYSSPIPQC
jgi:hypothetical protein